MTQALPRPGTPLPPDFPPEIIQFMNEQGIEVNAHNATAILNHLSQPPDKSPPDEADGRTPRPRRPDQPPWWKPLVPQTTQEWEIFILRLLAFQMAAFLIVYAFPRIREQNTAIRQMATELHHLSEQCPR